jgi:hypothetical protein
MASPELRVTLDCTIQVEAPALRVAYTLKNEMDTEVGVFNRLPTVRLDGTLQVLPENVYVDLEGITLHVKKLDLPVPKTLSVTVRLTPFVTRLPPRQAFQEEFRLHIPVAVCEPYRRALLTGTAPGADVVACKPAKAEIVTFSLGAFPVDKDIRFVSLAPALPGTFQVWPPGVAAARQVVLERTVRLASPLPVLDYQAVPANPTGG